MGAEQHPDEPTATEHRPNTRTDIHMATETDDNKEIVRRFEEALWNEHNLDVIEEFVAPDFVWHYPKGQTMNGPAEFRETAEYEFAAFPDLSQTTEDVIAEDDTVVMRFRVRGTHEGEFMGQEPTGNEFEVDEVHITRLEGGKIVERWSQADVMGMLEQLGVE